jgi:hypothetical protein
LAIFFWRESMREGMMLASVSRERDVMRVSGFQALALVAGICVVPLQVSAAPAYDCQLTRVFECTADAGCTKTTAQDRNLPPAVTLNVKQKNLFSGLFGGQGFLESGDVYEDDKVLILHGRRALQTWTAVVAKDTGAYSGSVSQLGKTYAEFGTCTGKDLE